MLCDRPAEQLAADIGDDSFRRPVSDDAAFGDDGNALAELLDIFNDVCSEDDSRALACFGEEV